MKMTTTIASVNCYGGFLKTNPKILRTFFTYILEAQQFTLAKVTLNQVLSTQVNSSRLDKVQNMPVEKILSAEFFIVGIRQRCFGNTSEIRDRFGKFFLVKTFISPLYDDIKLI